MAVRYAVASGNWSATSTWNGGTLPTSADDVYSNTFTVTVDTSPTVITVNNSATTGVTSGGTFTLTNGTTLTCTSTISTGAIGTSLITNNLTSGQSCTVNAPTFNGGVSLFPTPGYLMTHSTAGTVSMAGNITANNTQANHAIVVSGTGVLNITGNITGGAGAGSATWTVLNSNTATVNITGSVTASFGAGTNGGVISNSSSGTIFITGACTHSNASCPNLVLNGSTGSVTITGAVTNNTSNVGCVFNNSTGSLTINGTLTVGATGAVVGSGNAGQFTYLTGPFVCSPQGVVANFAYRWRWVPSVGSSYMAVPNSTATGYKNLYTADYSGSGSGQPSAANVRSGTVYGPSSELTGTCAVPAAASVASGVAVDATTGTAVITAATLRSAMGLASANLDTQLAAAALPTAAQIRAEMDSNSTKLANLDATVSSRLASSSYTTPPTAAANANAVWGSTVSTYNTNGTFGAGVLIGSSPQREVAVTGSHHVAANIHELQPAVINATHFASGALASVWTSATRTLTTTIPTASDIATAVWAYATRTLTAAVYSTSDITTAVWAATTRTITGGTVDTASNVPSAATVASATRTELATELSRLDAAISTRLASTDYTTAPTVAAIATEVWNSTVREITGGTVDTLVNTPDVPTPEEIAAATRLELAPELTHLDVDISTRSTFDAATDTVAHVTLVDTTTTLTNAPDVPTPTEIAAEVWTTATREITGGTVDSLVNAPDVPTPEEVATAVRTELNTELNRIDSTISSRLAEIDYIVPLDASQVRDAVGLTSANLDTQLDTLPTAIEIATAVWEAVDKTGYSLTTEERTAISDAVQAGILNEGDGQQILEAIVNAIGNQNIDEIALIAAIRADLERNDGMLSTRSTLTAGEIRTELTPELNRIANASTTQEVAEMIEGAMALPEE